MLFTLWTLKAINLEIIWEYEFVIKFKGSSDGGADRFLYMRVADISTTAKIISKSLDGNFQAIKSMQNIFDLFFVHHVLFLLHAIFLRIAIKSLLRKWVSLHLNQSKLSSNPSFYNLVKKSIRKLIFQIWKYILKFF